jgi:hypothetical protein
MSLRFALQLGWRCVLAIAMSATPWSAHARTCTMTAPDSQMQAASHAPASDMTMPCSAAADGMASMHPHGGAPHPHCPQGDCDSAACVGHCLVLAALPTMPAIVISQQQQVLVYAESSFPDRPPQERLRPPIA